MLDNSKNPAMWFDLKGSTKGRKTKFEGKDAFWWQKDKLGHKKVMKDNNFEQIMHDHNH